MIRVVAVGTFLAKHQAPPLFVLFLFRDCSFVWTLCMPVDPVQAFVQGQLATENETYRLCSSVWKVYSVCWANLV